MEKNGSFFQFKVSLQNWHTTYYWPRQGRSKGSTFQTFFPISDAVPHFLNGPYEIPKQLAVEKNLESKVYMKGTVRNDMFIRMAKPPLLVKFQNSLQPT